MTDKKETDIICGLNFEKGNLLTAYFGNISDMSPVEGTPVVHGELRLDYINNDKEQELIEFVLVTKIKGREPMFREYELAQLESEIVVEFFKSRKKTIFLDWDTKELYRLSNKPSLKASLGKAIVEEYIWSGDHNKIIRRTLN